MRLPRNTQLQLNHKLPILIFPSITPKGTNAKDQRADDTKARLSGRRERQRRCKTQQRPGKNAADQEVFSAELALIGSSLNHTVHYKICFYVIHSIISFLRFFVDRW